MRSERSESDTAVANDADRDLPQELDHEVARAGRPAGPLRRHPGATVNGFAQ
jgi:hypothetical protein